MLTTQIPKILDGKYETRQKIKEAGFSIVYLGWDKELARPVAIKEIHPKYFGDARYRQMFLDEAKNTAGLNHPNIVHIYQFIEGSDGSCYIVMEFIEGVDLRNLLVTCSEKGDKIPPHLSAYIIAEIGKALAYAHKKTNNLTGAPLNMIHLDVSPSNIMIAATGIVKLIDFGIARVRDLSHEDSKSSTIKGKIPYMSPEQVKNQRDIDHRSDIFSLGVVLFETITGQRLFEGNSDYELMENVAKVKFDGKRLDSPYISRDLVQVIKKAVQKNPENRYQSCDNMVADITGLLQKQNVNDPATGLGLLMQDLYNGNIELSVTNDSKAMVDAIIIKDVTKQKSDTVETPDNQPHPGQSQGVFAPIFLHTNEASAEQEPKTTIEGILVKTRGYKKQILFGLGGFITFILIFLAFDTVNQWTNAGNWIFNKIFPPAIQIESVPHNPKIYIDGQFMGTAPLSIDKIEPGSHKLSAYCTGYKPIELSFAISAKGEISSDRIRSKSILKISFSIPLIVNSLPEGAMVLINGILYPQRTPCTIEWELDKPMHLELVLNGLKKLTGFAYEITEDSLPKIQDPRKWDVQYLDSLERSFLVLGKFTRDIKITSKPGDAEIFIDNSEKAAARTGDGQYLNLTFGEHKIVLNKNGFLDLFFNLIVNETSDTIITKLFSRNVTVQAFDKMNPGREIKAKVTQVSGTGSKIFKTTPAIIPVPCEPHKLKISKPGFQDTAIVVQSNINKIAVELKRANPFVVFRVIDTQNIPVKGCNLYFQKVIESEPTFAEDKGRILGFIDKKGQMVNQMEPGHYFFWVIKDGIQSKPILTKIGYDDDYSDKPITIVLGKI